LISRYKKRARDPVGRNGAGKTTVIKSVMGLYAQKPEVFLMGRYCPFKPHEIARLGIGFVPEDRRIFQSPLLQKI
jgi:branched-chain amino acid transport system ATP-binding protein